MNEKLLLVNVAAQRLNCSRSYVYELIKDGELKAIRRKSYLRVYETSVDEFLKRRALDPESYFE